MKRSHKNNKRRLTAKERAEALIRDINTMSADSKPLGWWFSRDVGKAQRAIQAAVRQALARKERRAK